MFGGRSPTYSSSPGVGIVGQKGVVCRKWAAREEGSRPGYLPLPIAGYIKNPHPEITQEYLQSSLIFLDC